MPFKSFTQALVISSSLHALTIYAFYSPHLRETLESPAAKPIQISYIEIVKPPAEPVKSQTTVKLTKLSKYRKPWEAKKKLPAPVVPKKILSIKPAEVLTPSQPAHRKVVQPEIRGSAELLSDPEKGKVFSDYFGMVKAKIRLALQRKNTPRSYEDGRVTLLFVLNSNGSLEGVSILPSQSDADPMTKELAKQCLIEAAPFPNFPKELSSSRISFNVTVCFEKI